MIPKRSLGSRSPITFHDGQTGSRVDEHLTLVVALECESRVGGDGLAHGRTVADVAIVPSVGVVVLGHGLGQVGHLAAGVRHVQTDVPSEVAVLDHVNIHVAFPAPGVERTHVQSVQHEARGIRHTETLHNLVLAVSLEPGEVGVDAVVPEASFDTHLIAGGHLRLQVGVRAGEAILVAATAQTGFLELGVDAQGACVLTHLGNGAANLQVVEPADVLQRLELGEHP